MSERLSELERVVGNAVMPVLNGTAVRGVEIRTPADRNDVLDVIVKVGLAKQAFPKDILLRIVMAASEAIRETGEARFPRVLGRFARDQKFAA